MLNGCGKQFRGDYGRLRMGKGDIQSFKSAAYVPGKKEHVYMYGGDTDDALTRANNESVAPCVICVPDPEPTIHTDDSTTRKMFPIAEGVLDYFPDAIAYIAMVSFIGNQQHNPGEPMHWAREKSGDHANCIARHLEGRGTKDKKGVRHSGNLAWRALANLQEELERDLGLPCPRRATPLPGR